ncbi:CsbD family protein [Lentzea sp. NPDC051213]|uniref:CsbD family protein n=1 Tax=Lentzea sp. NPDC051213 TaxID=3364126 RepID=UPI00379B8F45
MGTDDKFDAKSDELKGKVKEGVGDATGDKSMQTEGKVDQAKGHLKESAEKIKDAFKKN